MFMRNFIILCLFLVLTSINGYSQDSKNRLSAEFGINMHGTGDMKGYQYGLRYNHFLSKSFDFIIAFEANLNDHSDKLFIWEDPDGNEYDSTLHDVLAGMQLNFGIGINLFNTQRHQFGLNPSIFFRYQADSQVDTIITDFPPITGYPVPIRYLIRESPGNTYAAGGSVRFFYNYKFSSKYFVGINPGFQLDSNEDTILFSTLSFGIRL